MRSVNKVILIGNLTRDPELRQTLTGQSIVTFGLATNREWVTKDGRKESSTEYHELAAWAKLGEICHQYLRKGKLVYVDGYLKTRSKDMPDGTKRFRTETVVQDMIMLDKREHDEPQRGASINQKPHSLLETLAPKRVDDMALVTDNIFEL